MISPTPADGPVGLSVTAIIYLNRLGDAIRAAPTARERTEAISIALAVGGRCRGDGASWAEIAVALGFAVGTVRSWLYADDVKPTPVAHPTVSAPRTMAPEAAPSDRATELQTELATGSMSMSSSQPIFQMASTPGSAGGGLSDGLQHLPGVHRREVVVASGDPRPGGNIFGLEAADIRRPLRLARVGVWESACVDLAEVRDHLDSRRPIVFHLTAHSSFGGVVLSMDGQAISVCHETFVRTITRSILPPRLIVLSVCASVPIAQLLAEAIESVIAWPDLLDDDQARDFARCLYQQLACGRTVADAFEVASDTTTERWPGLSAPILYGGTRKLLG